MNRELKKIIKLECLAFVFIFAIFSIFGFYPKLRKTYRLVKKIRLDRMAVEAVSPAERERQKKSLEETLNRMNEYFQIIQSNVAEIQNKIVKEKNIPLITQQIIDIANSAQVELTLIKPLTAQVSQDYEILPIEIRIRANYTDLIKFLSEVLTSPSLTTIQQLSINKDEVIYPRLDINLIAYVLFAPLHPESTRDESR